MLAAVRQVSDDLLQRAERSVLQPVGDKNFLYRHEVYTIAIERDPVQLRLPGDGFLLVGAPVAIGVPKHDAVTGFPAGHIDSAVLGNRDHPGFAEILCELRDPEGRREGELTNALVRRVNLLGFQDMPGNLAGDRRLLILRGHAGGDRANRHDESADADETCGARTCVFCYR